MENDYHNTRSPEAPLQTTSAGASSDAEEKAGTAKVAPNQPDILPELMLLQDGFNSGLAQGMRGRKEVAQTKSGEPVIVLYLIGVRECESCNFWHADAACPTCNPKKSEKGK